VGINVVDAQHQLVVQFAHLEGHDLFPIGERA